VADQSTGYAILFNILHIEDPVGLLREAARGLVPGGHAGILHWRNDLPTPRGPTLTIRPTAAQCRTWGEAAGLEFVREQELCCCSWHWGLVLRKPPAGNLNRSEGGDKQPHLRQSPHPTSEGLTDVGDAGQVGSVPLSIPLTRPDPVRRCTASNRSAQ
jgi:hypothetical protein